MSKLPQLNLRIPADYHQLVREIAARLRERDAPTFAHELDAFVLGLPSAPPMGGRLEGRVDDLEARLAELEGWRQGFYDPEPLRETPPPSPAKGVPDELLAQADDLNNQGWKWVDIVEHLGLKVQANSLRMRVTRRRNRGA